MTHHEKLVERYEDALFALMMEDVAETEGEKLQELNEQLKCDPAAEIPEELDERCIRTINISKEDMLRISESVEIR